MSGMRSYIFFLLLLISLVQCTSVNWIHRNAIVVDTHNDILSAGLLKGIDISKKVTTGHSDLVRWEKGGVDVQFFSVWTGNEPRTKDGFFHDAFQEIDTLDRFLLRNPSKTLFALNYKQVKKGAHRQKLVALIGVEGGHMIEDNLRKLESLYTAGMRYMTLTWNNSTSWASSAMDETLHSEKLKQKGLTEFGKEVVQKMNELGVMVDLSHTGEQTFYDAIATTTKPVILSHSSVWSICPVFRNVKDDQIKAVAKNGGVVCINFYSGFISKQWDATQRRLQDTVKAVLYNDFLKGTDSATATAKWKQYYDSTLNAARPSIDELIDHIDYIVKLVGDDYAGIGSDFDGIGSTPIGLDDVSSYPSITSALLNRGYSKKSIRKIMGGNVLRVMKANFK